LRKIPVFEINFPRHPAWEIFRHNIVNYDIKNKNTHLLNTASQKKLCEKKGDYETA
jgi:hypothetical protein